MPDLTFQIEGAEVVKSSAAPQITFKVRMTNADPAEAIQSVALRCQIQMDAARRRYSPQEQEKLLDLFGQPERWSQTLRSLLWTHVNVNAGAFCGSTVIDLPVPCTFDFNVAATKYFYGLSEGAVPLCAMFSGTVFYAADDGNFQIAPIPWEKEAYFQLPVKLWREMMDSFYPNSAWLCLRRDVFERLFEYKVRNGIPTWEQALERMMEAAADAREKESVR